MKMFSVKNMRMFQSKKIQYDKNSYKNKLFLFA